VSNDELTSEIFFWHSIETDTTLNICFTRAECCTRTSSAQLAKTSNHDTILSCKLRAVFEKQINMDVVSLENYLREAKVKRFSEQDMLFPSR
jgi:hypothetical protein